MLNQVSSNQGLTVFTYFEYLLTNQYDIKQFLMNSFSRGMIGKVVDKSKLY